MATPDVPAPEDGAAPSDGVASEDAASNDGLTGGATPGEAVPRATRDELLRHLDAAYNLARWICRDEHDAQDVVQEAFLRAVRFGHQCRPGSARAWLLRIVRNTSLTWAARGRGAAAGAAEALDQVAADADGDDGASPERVLQRRQEAAAVRRAIGLLPAEFREAIVLREIEGLSYKEVAEVTATPVGTVMSRLSRGRERLKELLAGYRAEVSDDL